MSANETLGAPYLGECGFCGNGLLRFWLCEEHDETIALCDECELYWTDPRAVKSDPNHPSSGAYPALEGNWRAATIDEISDRGLAELIEGDSE